MTPSLKITELQQKIGRIVESYRKKERLTQAKLAERINASRPTISHIENGKGGNTTILLKIFKYFGALEELDAFYGLMLKNLEEENELTDLDFYG